MVVHATALGSLAALLRKRSGLVIGEEKLYLLETRLASMLRREGLTSLEGLVRLIQIQGEQGALANDVVEAMTTNETSFFRDLYPFKHLERHGLPEALQAHQPGQRIRIWSAAASSGQEAFSIAMLLEEGCAAGTRPAAVIVGTDIARAPVAQAQQGCYTLLQVQRGLTAQRLHRHFEVKGDRWQIRAPLQALCQFRIWNLLDDLAPLGLFDIVFCRNVLMYFDSANKERVLAKIAAQLRPGGLLYLGSSDAITEMGGHLKPYQQERTIYQQCGSVDQLGATTASHLWP